MSDQPGRPLHCHQNEYPGPERRVEERREQCDLHSGLQQSYDDLRDLQKQACRKIDKMTSGIDSKVPMKLFYVMIGLVVAILAFQWTIYERVNSTALSNLNATNDIKLQISEVKASAETHQVQNNMEIQQLTRSVDRHIITSDRAISNINTGIKEVKRDVEEVKLTTKKLKNGG